VGCRTVDQQDDDGDDDDDDDNNNNNNNNNNNIPERAITDQTILANRTVIILCDKKEDLPTDRYSHTRRFEH
jgi:hypothetical protein